MYRYDSSPLGKVVYFSAYALASLRAYTVTPPAQEHDLIVCYRIFCSRTGNAQWTGIIQRDLKALLGITPSRIFSNLKVLEHRHLVSRYKVNFVGTKNGHSSRLWLQRFAPSV